jgi:hypothetical protein
MGVTGAGSKWGSTDVLPNRPLASQRAAAAVAVRVDPFFILFYLSCTLRVYVTAAVVCVCVCACVCVKL